MSDFIIPVLGMILWVWWMTKDNPDVKSDSEIIEELKAQVENLRGRNTELMIQNALLHETIQNVVKKQ